jgi:hypothetical protein
MSASTQVEKAAKSYEKFLKKLGVRPKSVDALAKAAKCSPGTARRMAKKAAGAGVATESKKGNGFQYARASTAAVAVTP